MGMNFTEIILIAAVAVLVLGPKQATQLAFKAGSLFGKVKAYLNELKRELDAEDAGIAKSVQDVKNTIYQTSSDIHHNLAASKVASSDTPRFTASYKPAAFSSSELLDEISSLKLEIASMKKSHRPTRAKAANLKMRRRSHVRS